MSKLLWAYPDDYRIKPIKEQIEILRELFPGLGSVDKSIFTKPIPMKAEEWFAIPRWEKLASTYSEAVEKVLEIIGFKLNFYNSLKGQISPQHLRQHAKSKKALQKLSDKQDGHDILLVPCQLGNLYANKSVNKARKLMNANEFGLGVFAVGCILLTDPENKYKYERFNIDCAGDEYSWYTESDFSNSLYFFFRGDRIEFGYRWIVAPPENYGSASAFLQY